MGWGIINPAAQQPLLIIIALLAATLAFSVSRPAQKIKAIRELIVTSSLVALMLGVNAAMAFDKSVCGFQYQFRFDVRQIYNLNFTGGVDGISLVLIVLTLFIFPCCFLSARTVTKAPKQFYNYVLSRELLLVITFTTTDLFYFYVFFESLLIPMFILIGVWGARERKIKAAYYFFLYTLFGSLIRLFGVLYLYFLTGSTNFYVLINSALCEDDQVVI